MKEWKPISNTVIHFREKYSQSLSSISTRYSDNTYIWGIPVQIDIFDFFPRNIL